MTSEILNEPSPKFFICDLSQCSRGSKGTDPKSSAVWAWCSENGQKKKQFVVVWIQGTVTKIEDNGDVFYINDGTGMAKVVGCTRIPFVTGKAKMGDYMMVIGQLLSSSHIPEVKVIKLQQLPSGHMETWWKVEVQDQKLLAT